ncbi:class I SAM-dependent methyltransferase [Thiomicrorhabdus lithotrophica]|uniref:Ribosomal RNA small subunit methyltransferase J n=1 Tax=Thiomicrorhabdus lithotrophica TaxID=2949997 RepID=A0ABY8C825_9GAMM|nr:class I SAM-dependent methyltransferase [Thiomicrorhabdus lithotrophica]WEJ62059.1 class I SAM-dependent methyltransferase [Thiomicrorhabdus lithotrophica]
MSLSTETFTDICIANTYPEKSQPLSKQLNLSICSESNIEQWLDWVNDKKDSTLKLALCSKKQGPVSIDFLSGKKAHRRQFGGGKGQPLVRAMGQLEQGVPKIIDATAGMGGDSYVLASLGFKVQMIERSPIVAALLNDALTRAIQSLDADLPAELQESIQNLSLVNANSADYLLNNQPDVDVIYMDPMYPEKKKKAAAKKEMQALQQLVGPDLDSEKLLEAALKTAKYRVVVKRPKGADPVYCALNNIQPSSNISSPNTRYDIYVIKALKASGQL